MAKPFKLTPFSGGIHPDDHKAESCEHPIAPLPLAPLLTVPLHQRIGGTPRPLVEVGQQVLKGERIGAADGMLSAAVHASTSGVVRAIEPAVMPHPSGLSGLAVCIEADGEDRWIEREPVAWHTRPADELRDLLRDSGLLGLGGAVFPTHVKLQRGSSKLRKLILNGAECEPYISCDDRLMRERADGIVAGIRIMAHLLAAEEVLIGIEDNKPQALAAMRAATAGSGFAVHALPTRYPAGGEKQLIRLLTGLEIPHGRRPTEFGVQCFNVGTAYGVHRALDHGEPLVSRIVTVAGNVARPGNFEVPIGTPMQHVANTAGVLANTDRYIMGGPMMGVLMPNFSVPVAKGSNCILVASPQLFPPPPPEMPCIRCGECARACPADLQPFELYWFARAKNFGKAQEYHLFDCIECGCCAYVCPANIPLVDYYRFAKGEIWARERDKDAADLARQRFEFRNERMEREKAEKAAKLAAKAAATRDKLAGAGAAESSAAAPAAASAAAAATPASADKDTTKDAAKQALIAAALERARQQREASAARNVDVEALSAAKRTEIAEIEARRAAIAEVTQAPQTPQVQTATTADHPVSAAAPGTTPAAAPEERP